MNSVQSKRSFGEAGLEGGCDAKRFSDASSYAAKMLDGPLGRIGLRREPGDASAGALYQGDGVLSSGWYWAWSHRQEFVVVACDFTLLERLPFRIDVERYFAVRRESSGMLPRASVSAFMETLPRTSTIVLPKGVRFSYVEVEYYDDYCEAVFGGDVGRALSPLASCLGELKGAASWDPDIEGMLAGIGPGMASGVGGALALSSLADGLMSKLVGMRERIGGGVSAQDRRSILECVDFVRREIGSAIRQEDLTGVAKMGPTKF